MREPHTPNEATVDIHVTTLDDQGRLRLATIARTMGWPSGQDLELSLRAGTVRLVPAARPGSHQRGIRVTLDSRQRVRLPYGIRTFLHLRAGTRMILLAARAEGIVVGIPSALLVDRLTTHL